MRSCTLCWDVLVLQGIYVLLRRPGNVTMSPYWNWTRSWVTMMTSSSTTAGGERAVPVAVLMTHCNRLAVSVSASSTPTGIVYDNVHVSYHKLLITIVVITLSRPTDTILLPCFGQYYTRVGTELRQTDFA